MELDVNAEPNRLLAKRFVRVSLTWARREAYLSTVKRHLRCPDVTKQKFFVDNKIDIRADGEGPVLCTLDTRYYFELVGAQVNNKLADEVHVSANTIALSTTRGILFSRLRGTS